MAPRLTAILALDHKLGRVVANGKGVTLSSAEADLLAELGVIKLLGDAKDAALREAVEARAIQASPPSRQPSQPRRVPLTDHLTEEQSKAVEEAERRRCLIAIHGTKGEQVR